MSSGLGSLSGLGVGKEVTPGTGVDSSVFIPILSESIKPSRENVESGSIVGDSMVQAVSPGTIQVEGGITCELEGSVSGQLIAYANGLNGYSSTAFSATFGHTTAAPTLAASSSGALAAGDYRVRVATVLNRTADGQKLIMPASAESSQLVGVTLNQKIDVTWVNPSGFPDGHTQAGTVVYMTPVNGAVDTEYYRKYQSGTATTTSVLGNEASADTAVTYWTGSLKRHSFIGTPPVTGERLPFFTTNVLKNNDKSERYIQCLMDSLKLGVGGANEAMNLDCTMKGTKAETINNFSPSFVPLEPFVGWHALAQINSVTDCTLETFELNLANNVNFIPGLCATPFNRGVISGKRQVTGTMTRQFENHDFWLRMYRGEDFSIRFTAFGQPLVSMGASLNTTGTINHGIDAVPYQYFMEIDLYRCKINEAGGNISGPDRIIETVGFTAFKSVSAGTEMRIRLYNTVSTYDA